jgi:hypothetical protein
MASAQSYVIEDLGAPGRTETSLSEGVARRLVVGRQGKWPTPRATPDSFTHPPADPPGASCSASATTDPRPSVHGERCSISSTRFSDGHPARVSAFARWSCDVPARQVTDGASDLTGEALLTRPPGPRGRQEALSLQGAGRCLRKDVLQGRCLLARAGIRPGSATGRTRNQEPGAPAPLFEGVSWRSGFLTARAKMAG